MLDHVSIPVHDVATSVPFHDAVMGSLGHHRVHASDTVEHGGTGISEPCLRVEYRPTHYAAFVTDTSGNRLEA